MKNKIIITALFIVFTLCAQAQDKYQFMVLKCKIEKHHILCMSIDGEEYVKEEVEEPKEIAWNVNPVLKKVKALQKENWEVMSFESGGMCVYLRKKIETK